MLERLAKMLWKLWGWKLKGSWPEAVKKAIVIVIPHTSNWDFPVGLLARRIMKKDIKFVGKSSLFKWPFGRIFKALGGYPVDRSKSNNFVDSIVEIFDSKEEFLVCIAPEGTRAKPERLKTGFWFIAKGGDIPIIPVSFDWPSKTVEIGRPIFPSDSLEADLQLLKEHYSGILGKNPTMGWGYINSR